MPLQRQTIDIPVGFGIDENSGKPSIQSGKLMRAVDFRIAKVGELETRTGYEAVTKTARDGNTGGTVAINAGETCFEHGGAVLVSDGSKLYRYSESLKQLCRVDDYPEFTIADRKRVIHGGPHAPGGASAHSYFTPWGYDDCCEAVYCDGCWVVTYMGNGANIAVFDATTMARIGSWNGADVRGRLVADRVYVYWITKSHVFRIRPRAVSDGWLSSTSFQFADNLDHIDACVQGGYLYVVGKAIATDNLTAYAISTTTFMSDHYVNSTAYTNPACVCADANHVYIFSHEKPGTTGGDWKLLTYSPTLTLETHTTFPSVPISCAAKPDLSGPVAAAMDYVLGENLTNHQANPLCVWGYVSGSFVRHSQTHHIQPISGIAFVGGRLYGAVASEVRQVLAGGESGYMRAPYDPATGHLCEFPLQLDSNGDPYQARPITRFAKDSIFYSQDYEYAPRRAPLAAGPNGELVLPILIAGEINGDMPGGYAELPLEREASGIDLFLFGANDSSQLSTIDVCGTPICSGGILCTPNRDSVSEIGFAWRPSIGIYPTLTAAKTFSAGLTGGGRYLYCAIYCYVDDYGNVQRSEPSDVVSVEVGTPGTGEIVVATVFAIPHTLTGKSRWERPSAYRPEFIELYRTTAGGTEFHYVRTVDMGTDADTIQFVDCMADVEAGTCRTLYTDGGVLENVAPPCAKAIARSPSRIAIVSGDDPDTVWFSKQIIQGEVPGFHEQLTCKIPDGPITALAYLGDCLLVFTAQSIWCIVGQGPNDQGQASDFSEPRMVSNAIGCTDPRSVLQYQGGVFFRASAGIHRIDSQLQVAFVGSAVRDQLASATITGACALPESQELLWATSTGNVIVYSAAFDQWLTWAPRDSEGVVGTRCNGIAGGALLLESGELLIPNGTQIEADGMHRVSPTLATAWLHMAGIQGFQRARQLSFLASGCAGASATVSLSYDYKDTPFWSRTWTADQIAALSLDGIEELEVHLPRQKCAAVQATLSFACADDSAPKVQGMSLDVGILPGQHRRGSASRGSNE